MLLVEIQPDPADGRFVAQLPGLPAIGAGRTVEEAIAELKESVKGYIAAFGIQNARARLKSPTICRVDWTLEELGPGSNA